MEIISCYQYNTFPFHPSSQIKTALNMHLFAPKKCLLENKYGAFIDALLLMLLTKFVDPK